MMLLRQLAVGMERKFLIAKSMHSLKLLILDKLTAGADIELCTQL